MVSHQHPHFMTVHEMLAEGEDSVRHSTPISEEELLSMVEYILETRSFSEASHPEWTIAVDSPSVNFIKRPIKKSGTVRTRSWAKIAGVPPQALLKCVYDCKLRLDFDEYFVRFQVSRSIDDAMDVLVSQVDSPVGISDREFVEWRRCFLSELRDDRASLVYAIELRSCDDSQCSASVRPSPKRVERAETWLSGYVFKWWLDENGAPRGSEVFVMSEVDLRGSLPKIFVNNAVTSGPVKWSSSLADAGRRLCASKGVKDLSKSDRELEELFGVPRGNRGASGVVQSTS